MDFSFHKVKGKRANVCSTASSDMPCEPGSSWRAGGLSSLGSQACAHTQYNIILFDRFVQHMKKDGARQGKQPGLSLTALSSDLVVPGCSEEHSRQEGSRRRWVRAVHMQEIR